MRISKLLMGDHRGFSNVIAKALGVNEAIALNQIDYWIEYNARDRSKQETHFVDGRWWVFNTYEDWQSENFDFWSISTIKRVFAELEKGKDPVLLSRKFGSKKGKHTKWYSIDYDALDRAIKPHMPDSVNLSQSRSGHSDTIGSGQSDTIGSGQLELIRSGHSDPFRNGSICTNLDRVNLEFSYKETETTPETTSSESTDREKGCFPQTDFANAQVGPVAAAPDAEPHTETPDTPTPTPTTLVVQPSGSARTRVPGSSENDSQSLTIGAVTYRQSPASIDLSEKWERDKMAASLEARSLAPGHKYPWLVAHGLGAVWVGPGKTDFDADLLSLIARYKRDEWRQDSSRGACVRFICNLINKGADTELQTYWDEAQTGARNEPVVPSRKPSRYGIDVAATTERLRRKYGPREAANA